MEKFKRTAILLLSWFILCSLILCSIGDGEGQKGDDQERKTLAGTLNSVLSRATTSTKSNWGKAKAWIHEVQLRFFPPNLDFRTGEEAKSNGAGEKVKEAVEKSFGTSKSAVEDTAKSAGKAVGEAVHKTTEKVKKKVHDTSGRSHEDL